MTCLAEEVHNPTVLRGHVHEGRVGIQAERELAVRCAAADVSPVRRRAGAFICARNGREEPRDTCG